MRLLTKEEFLVEKDYFIKEIKKGAIFIYPTDTIYGIGCNAEIDSSVIKIRDLKKRPARPFSIIAPSKAWVREYCITKELDKLPGPYTYILKLKKALHDLDKKPFSQYVNPGLDSIGIRIPDNWFSKIISFAKVPFVTTSVNKSGESFMTSLDDLDPDIRQGADYIIYEGKKQGKPSVIIDYTKEKANVVKR